MKNMKDYESSKKEFIKLQDLNSDNIYTYFSNDDMLLLIRRYYEIYTKFLFNQLMGSLRLEVSSQKAEKLMNLKGVGSWEFAGMIDVYERGKETCELGHPLRYVYKARNVDNGEILNFGARCVGDFFDIDSKGIRALIRVKDEMFEELKEMVAIKQLGLMDEHYTYDCGKLGVMIKLFGLGGVKKAIGLNPLMPIVSDFVALGLPLPKSLIKQIIKYDGDLGSLMISPKYLEVDIDKLNILRNSEISLVSAMFSNSYQAVLDNIEHGRSSNVSDFYNFMTIQELNIAISHWLNRTERLLKAQDYFRKQGIDLPWIDIYKHMIKNRLYADNPKIYYGVETLLVFDKNIVVESTVYMPKDYGYKGYQLSPRAHEDFDDLISYLATKEFLMALKDIYSSLNVVVEKENQEKSEQEDMMVFLRENLDKEEYSSLKGIMGVRDIILRKKLEIDGMSEKQLSYVKSVYQAMKSQNEPTTEATEDNKAVNNRYTLSEKPEILAKIQRLQREVDDLPSLTEKILNTVMSSKFVSDKQIAQIDKAFDKYILKQEVSEDKPTDIVKKVENKKWNLIERPDVKDKILEIKRHSEYSNIPMSIRNIFTNILKYNMASEKQIEVVENTYKRYFGRSH